MKEQQTYMPPEVEFKLQRRAIVTLAGKGLLLGALGAGNVWVFNKLSELGLAVPTQTPEQPMPVVVDAPKPLSTVIPKDTRRLLEVRDPYQIGPLNFKGFGDEQTGPIKPAPPIFLFTKKPDGKYISLYFTPKALEKHDSIKTVFDWKNPYNATIFNVTERHDGLQFGNVLATAHSGFDIWRLRNLPAEDWRSLLEDHGAWYSLVRSTMENAPVVAVHGYLSKDQDERKVTPDGKGLINPVFTTGRLTGIAWLSPDNTDTWEETSEKARTDPSVIADIDKYINPGDHIAITPGKDFRVIFCSNRGGIFKSRYVLSFSTDTK